MASAAVLPKLPSRRSATCRVLQIKVLPENKDTLGRRYANEINRHFR